MRQLNQRIHIHAIDNVVDIVLFEFEKFEVVHVKNAMVNVWTKCNSGEQQLMRQSTHLHTVTKLSDKEFSAIVETNEPLIVLLEYTFASNTTLVEDSIQARLGGSRLPTTIIDANVVVSNICNVVAVQIHFALVSVSVKLYTSVCRMPVAVVSNGVEHLAFDLTHDLKRFVNLRLVWAMMGAIATPCVTLDQLVSDCLHDIAVFAHDVTEGVSDVSVGSALVMHGEAEVHSTVQIGRGFGLAQSRAGDGEIVHATIISTGFGDLGSLVDSVPTVTPG